MDFIYINELLSKISKVKEQKVFVSKVDKFCLIGPLMSKSSCALCFKKRLLSSSIRRIDAYKNPSQKEMDELKNILTERSMNLSFDGMIEVDLGSRKIIKKHIVLPIPGCKKCERTYE